MYWNTLQLTDREQRATINRNMRCIEMFIPAVRPIRLSWLIETWDVLKYPMWRIKTLTEQLINRNMRCIEIPIKAKQGKTFGRLIETWDVLKCSCASAIAIPDMWLIETWDVLKWWKNWLRNSRKALINRNMRCIEISLSWSPPDRGYRLIETWDVLK